MIQPPVGQIPLNRGRSRVARRPSAVRPADELPCTVIPRKPPNMRRAVYSLDHISPSRDALPQKEKELLYDVPVIPRAPAPKPRMASPVLLAKVSEDTVICCKRGPLFPPDEDDVGPSSRHISHSRSLSGSGSHSRSRYSARREAELLRFLLSPAPPDLKGKGKAPQPTRPGVQRRTSSSNLCNACGNLHPTKSSSSSNSPSPPTSPASARSWLSFATSTSSSGSSSSRSSLFSAVSEASSAVTSPSTSPPTSSIVVPPPKLSASNRRTSSVLNLNLRIGNWLASSPSDSPPAPDPPATTCHCPASRVTVALAESPLSLPVVELTSSAASKSLTSARSTKSEPGISTPSKPHSTFGQVIAYAKSLQEAYIRAAAFSVGGLEGDNWESVAIAVREESIHATRNTSKDFTALKPPGYRASPSSTRQAFVVPPVPLRDSDDDDFLTFPLHPPPFPSSAFHDVKDSIWDSADPDADVPSPITDSSGRIGRSRTRSPRSFSSSPERRTSLTSPLPFRTYFASSSSSIPKPLAHLLVGDNADAFRATDEPVLRPRLVANPAYLRLLALQNLLIEVGEPFYVPTSTGFSSPEEAAAMAERKCVGKEKIIGWGVVAGTGACREGRESLQVGRRSRLREWVMPVNGES